jgi:hypothetical protein
MRKDLLEQAKELCRVTRDQEWKPDTYMAVPWGVLPELVAEIERLSEIVIADRSQLIKMRPDPTGRNRVKLPLSEDTYQQLAAEELGLDRWREIYISRQPSPELREPELRTVSVKPLCFQGDPAVPHCHRLTPCWLDNIETCPCLMARPPSA